MCEKKRGNADLSRLEYTKARNKVTKLIRKAKRTFEGDVAEKALTNPKAFWCHVNSKLKSKVGVSPLLENEDDKESIKFYDKEKANILQKHFYSVFTNEPEGNIPILTRRTDTCISTMHATSDMIKKKIMDININKSCGPGDIHPRVLNELVGIISNPIAQLLNRTMDEGVIPNDWKHAIISAIYKKGSRTFASNYRPISLTSIICKLMETFVKCELMTHLINENLLSTKQHGFISGRSTTTQLLNYLDQCVETIVDGGVGDSIYMDFAKAFDSVPRRRLIAKL